MRRHPTQEQLKALLDYDSITGAWTWKVRDASAFQPIARSERGTVSAETQCEFWNRLYAGKLAGGPDAKGYIVIRFGKYQYKAHILAIIYVTGEQPTHMVDHRDEVRSNNAYDNIRIATRAQNSMNIGARANNSLGVKGIRRRGNKFEARLSANGSTCHLGTFDTVEKAKAAVSIAAAAIHGEFAHHSVTGAI